MVFKGEVWRFTVEPFSIPITAITATASSTHDAEMLPEKTIDGSGLDELDQHSHDSPDMWLSGTGDPDIWIQYAFDRAYKLHEMWVWNSNQSIETFLGLGVKEATIEVSTDGDTWTVLENVPIFAQASSRPDYAHNTTMDFGGTQARLVKIKVNSGLRSTTPEWTILPCPMPCSGPSGFPGTSICLLWEPICRTSRS